MVSESMSFKKVRVPLDESETVMMPEDESGYKSKETHNSHGSFLCQNYWRNKEKTIRRSKRNSWIELCNGINDIPSAARIHKDLSKSQTKRVALSQKSDSPITQNAKETLMAQTHFTHSTKDHTRNSA